MHRFVGYFRSHDLKLSLFRGYMAMYIWAWTVNFIYFYFFHGDTRVAIACALGIPIAITATVLHERGQQLLATLFRTLSAAGIIGYISWRTGKANSPILFWLMSVVLGATLVFGMRAGIVVFAVSITLIVGLIPFTESTDFLTTFTLLALTPYMLVIGLVFVKITNYYIEKFRSEKRKVEVSLQKLQGIYDNIPQKIAIFAESKSLQYPVMIEGSRFQSKQLEGALDELGFTTADMIMHRAYLGAALGNEALTFEMQPFAHYVKSSLGSFSLHWSPLLNSEGLVQQIILTAEDVTKAEQQEQVSKEREEQNEIIVCLVNMSRTQSLLLIHSAREMIQTIKQHGAASKSKLTAHSLKGMFRSFGLSSLASLVHRFEDGELTLEPIELGFQTVLGCYEKIYGQAEGGNQIVIAEDEAFKAILQGRERTVLIDKVFSPAAQLIGHLPSVASAQRVAARIGKKVQVQLHDEGELFLNSIGVTLDQALVHIIANAIDHGIGREGTIFLTVKHDVLIVRDSGHGLNMPALRSKGQSLGLLQTDSDLQDVVNLLFHVGFSSRDEITELSGRGYGLSSARENLENMGFRMSLVLQESHSEFVGFAIHIHVPSVWVLSGTAIERAIQVA